MSTIRSAKHRNHPSLGVDILTTILVDVLYLIWYAYLHVRSTSLGRFLSRGSSTYIMKVDGVKYLVGLQTVRRL